MADTLDLGSSAARREGSSPSFRTKFSNPELQSELQSELLHLWKYFGSQEFD